jgi:hypothetical protein
VLGNYKQDLKTLRENAIQSLFLSIESGRPPSSGTTTATGKHATWDGIDDGSRSKIDEDPHLEEENPWKISASRVEWFHSPRIALLPHIRC